MQNEKRKAIEQNQHRWENYSVGVIEETRARNRCPKSKSLWRSGVPSIVPGEARMMGRLSLDWDRCAAPLIAAAREQRLQALSGVWQRLSEIPSWMIWWIWWPLVVAPWEVW